MFRFLKEKFFGGARPAADAPERPAEAPVAPPPEAGTATSAPSAEATSIQAGAAPASAGADGTDAAAAAVSAGMPPGPNDATAPGAASAATRQGWLGRLREGLKKTGASLSAVFVGARIDEALFEELETALLLADAGAPATQALMEDLRRRVREARASEPAQVRALLAAVIADWLQPLQKALEVGAQTDGPTVWMVAGVNGAGKTTTIGKLTWHLAQHGATVLLAAADTFRAAAREQLGVWAERNGVDIVAQAGGDPAAVAFDAVSAGRARGKDVVIVDTAGRLPTQLHLMEELRKVKRVVAKAEPGAPHEVLLVLDGNTGQNALAQVKAFDAALGLTGLIVTKLDGTAKGGVLCAIAQWAREQRRTLPVYFIGVGERLEDLQPFDAREFAQALLA